MRDCCLYYAPVHGQILPRQILPKDVAEFCRERGLPYGAALESALTRGDCAPYVHVFTAEQLAFFARIGGHLIVATPDVMLYTTDQGELQHSLLVQAMNPIAAAGRPVVLPALRKVLEIVTLEILTDTVPGARPAMAWLSGRYGTASVTLNALAGNNAALAKMLAVGGEADGGQQYQEAKEVR